MIKLNFSKISKYFDTQKVYIRRFSKHCLDATGFKPRPSQFLSDTANHYATAKHEQDKKHSNWGPALPTRLKNLFRFEPIPAARGVPKLPSY